MLPTERASLRYGILLASQISLIFLVIFTWTLLGTGRPSPVRTNPESAGSSERAALTATHVDAGIVSKAPVRSSTHAGEIRKSTPLSNLIRRGIGLAWVIGAALILSWRPVQLLRTRRIGLLLEPGRTLGYRIPLGSTLNSLGLAALFIISTHQVALFAAETINQAERINHIEAASLYRLPADSPIPRDAKMKLSGNIYSPDGKPVKALVYKTEMRPSADGIGNSSSYNSKLTNQYIEDFSFWRKWGQQPATFLESVNLLALAPGFTPSQEINIPAEPGERKINLYLKPAIASSIQVVDTDGNPVPGARLRYDYLIRNTDSLHFSPTPIQSPEKLTTDENGLVHWAAPEDFPIRFEVTADGYLDLFHKQIRFTKAEASPVFTLFPGHPLRGRIIDAETGKGIAGAEIQYLASFPRGHRPYASWHSDDRLSKSDTEGRFITYRLEADGRHWLVARAPGYLAAFPGQIDGRNAETFDERFSVRVKDSESPVFRMIPQRPIRIEITPPEGMQPDAMELYIKSKLFVGSKNTVSNPWSSSLKIQTREISADGKKLIVETTPVAVSPIEVKLRVPGRPSRIIQDWRYGTDLEADFRAAPATRRDKTLVYVTFDLP
ncbi:MAG: hypothetical protein PF795_01520, partial [Kiritimatiellae bacterium]|nr:hypothetical protein [Kiritimatiellia bacterium]